MTMRKAIKGFEGVHRYWDEISQKCMAKIKPGEFYVTQQEELITTVLGSCISACVRDPDNRIGGMNHFMLPQSQAGAVMEKSRKNVMLGARYGNHAMELLINQILKNGGSKHRLIFKLFGGGRILNCLTDIGKNNIDFVHEYIRVEGLKLINEDVGGIFPRKIIFNPMTGEVKVKKLRTTKEVIELEDSYNRKISNEKISGDVDLF